MRVFHNIYQIKSSNSWPAGWRIISMTLVFMILWIESFGNVFAAPADKPKQDVVKFTLVAKRRGSRKPLCVGDKVTFGVHAKVAIYGKGQSNPRVSIKILGFDVTATGDNYLKLISASPVKLELASNNRSAEFSFEGVAPGTAKVYFDAMVPVNYLTDETLAKNTPEQLNRMLYISDSAQVKVVDCGIKVSEIDKYEINAGEGYLVDMVAVLNDTTLVSSDPDGKVYTGEGTQQVVTRQFAPGCKVIIGVGTRPVKITAERLAESLKITLQYSAMTVQDYTECEGQGVALPIQFPDVGDFNFEIPLKGGHHEYWTSQMGFQVDLHTHVTRVRPK